MNSEEKPIKYEIRIIGKDFLVAKSHQEIFNFKEFEHVEKIQEIKFYHTKFPNGIVDFSVFENCKELELHKCSVKKITGWPAEIQKVRLFACKEIEEIPLERKNDQNLLEIDFNRDDDYSSKGFLYSVVKNNRIELSSNMPYFDIDELNLQKNRYTECVISLRIIESIFPGGVADFSMFTNCTDIYLLECEVKKIVAWPPNIKKIKLSDCKNLRSIPVEGTHYQFLEEIFFSGISLEDWNIDFAPYYKLRKITIYGPQPKISSVAPFTMIPQKWTLCFLLGELNLAYLDDLRDIPIEFSYMSDIQISICDCRHFPNLSYLPIDFWDVTEVYNYSDDMGEFTDKFHPRYYKNRELYEKYSKTPLIEREPISLDEIHWTRGRVKYIEYVESIIPRIQERSLQEALINYVRFCRPRITLKNDFEIFL